MTRRRRLAHRDLFERPIVTELRETVAGISIVHLDEPMDLLIGYRGHAFPCDIKSITVGRKPHARSKGCCELIRWDFWRPNRTYLESLTIPQREFVATWPAPWLVATSVHEVRMFLAHLGEGAQW